MNEHLPWEEYKRTEMSRLDRIAIRLLGIKIDESGDVLRTHARWKWVASKLADLALKDGLVVVRREDTFVISNDDEENTPRMELSWGRR